MNTKYFAWTAIALVAIAIIGSFFIIGSPIHQRMVRMDERRVSDLGYLQQQIINYWQSKDKLPASLEELYDPIKGNSIPVDPQNGSDYEYSIDKNKTNSFSLCANFSLETENSSDNMYYSLSDYPSPYYDGTPQSWNHPAGHHCFSRYIDPEIYKGI